MELPAAFKTKYEKLLGDQAESFFSTFDQPANNGLKKNPKRPHLLILI